MTIEQNVIRKGKIVAIRTTKIRRAVEMIVEASENWNNEIRDGLEKLSEREQIEFMGSAGIAVRELGGYIAAAGGER